MLLFSFFPRWLDCGKPVKVPRLARQMPVLWIVLEKPGHWMYGSFFFSLQRETESWDFSFTCFVLSWATMRNYSFYKLYLSELQDWQDKIQSWGAFLEILGRCMCELFPSSGRSWVLGHLFLIICHHARSEDTGKRMSRIYPYQLH